MNLAFCLFKYFPYGGLQRDFLRIVNLCLKHGHNVTVYTMFWQGDKPSHPHFQLKLLAAEGKTNHSIAYNFNYILQQEFARNTYDLTIGFNKLSGLDIYYCADSCYLAKTDEQKNAFINYIYKLTNRYKKYKYLESEVFDYNKTKILFLSDNERAHYKKYYTLSDSQCYLLPPNIDKTRFNINLLKNKTELKSELLKQLGRSSKNNNNYNNTKILLAIGSGFRTKGLDRNIKLLQYLNHNVNLDTLLIVIGDDKHIFYKNFAKKLGVAHKIFFLGGRDDIAKFLAAADLLVHPAYRENTGTVILESIIMGLPVVASGICGYSQYISESGCGKVIDEPFSQGYYNLTVKQLLSNAKQLDDMTQLGLEFRKTANIYNADEKILDIINL